MGWMPDGICYLRAKIACVSMRGRVCALAGRAATRTHAYLPKYDKHGNVDGRVPQLVKTRKEFFDNRRASALCSFHIKHPCKGHFGTRAREASWRGPD